MSIRKEMIKEAILRRRGFFSLDQIIAETGYSRAIVQDLLDFFAGEGLIHETERSGSIGRPGIYRINRAEEGDTIASNRMWKVIRYKREFALRDLIILGNARRENARSFIKSLHRAGFIMPNKPTGRGIFWMLVKDPGPKRPYVGVQRGVSRKRKTKVCNGRAAQ